MMTLHKDKLFLVLITLLGITLLSWFLVFAINLEPHIIGVILIIFAVVKVRLIIIHYMEANKAYLPIRIAFEAWVIVVAGITITLYLL